MATPAPALSAGGQMRHDHDVCNRPAPPPPTPAIRWSCRGPSDPPSPLPPRALVSMNHCYRRFQGLYRSMQALFSLGAVSAGCLWFPARCRPGSVPVYSFESPELRWHPNNASIAGFLPPPRTFRVHPLACANLMQLIQRVKRRFITTEAILEPILLPADRTSQADRTHRWWRGPEKVRAEYAYSRSEKDLAWIVQWRWHLHHQWIPEDNWTIALVVPCWSPARG